MNINIHKRQGQMDYSNIYFYTETIFEFKPLLEDDSLKLIIINSWRHLIEQGKIKIYGYVIMPNHFHVIWSMLNLNGKESPAGSFAKFTAHEFKKYLYQHDNDKLKNYESIKRDRKYQFWKRDPLAISLSSEKTFLQKLGYTHYNPVSQKWRLADTPESYRWSSANYYENGIDEFRIISDYRL